ncbi:hypothetical protein Tco_1216625 [Tanacetum coccineum]
MELMEKRRKHFAALKAQEKRNRPPTKAQKRTQMSTYLKHMGEYTYKQIKGKSFDEIQKLFDKEMKRVNTFVAMGSKDEDISIDAIPLATKLPVIIDYKLHKEGMLVHYQLIIADGSSKRYSSMIRMLQGIDREDLEALWRKKSKVWRYKVKTLEVALKRKSKKVVLLDSEGEEAENSSKQGRKTNTLTHVASGVNTGSTPDKAQRKGKAKMVKENVRLQAHSDAEVAEQIYTDEMIAKRMEEESEMTDQQKQRMAQVQFEAQYYTEEDWDIIRAKLEANAELVKNMHGEDLSKEDFAKRMNQGTWKLSQLKKLTFEEIKKKFDKLVNQIDTFVPMGFTELQEKVAAKDVPVTEEKARETTVPKEEKVEKSTKIKRRRLKTKARKGLNVVKDAQGDGGGRRKYWLKS